MLRYLKLLLCFFRFQASKAMEFRVEMWFRVVLGVLFYIVHILFFKIIYLHTSDLGGWNEAQVMIFIAGYFVTDALYMLFVAESMHFIPLRVNDGSLDYYLVRPVSSLFLLSFQAPAVVSLLNLLISGCFLGWALSEYPGFWTIGTLIGYCFMLFCGFFIFYLLRIIMVLPVFWTHSVRFGSNMFFSLLRAADRPDTIYQGVLRQIFVYCLPFGMIASFPARFFFQELSLLQFVMFFVTILWLFLLLLFMWERALRVYSSASS